MQYFGKLYTTLLVPNINNLVLLCLRLAFNWVINGDHLIYMHIAFVLEKYKMRNSG